MRLGVFGGSFDPVHQGHMILAQFALEQLELDRVVFLPSFNPPHKQGQIATSFEDRLRMLELALEGRKGFSISTLEALRSGPSYSLDSLDAIEKEYEVSKLYFLIGGDSLMGMEGWYKSEELLRRFSFGVAPRPGRTRQELEDKINQLGGDIVLIDSPKIEISSSSIRKRLEEKKPISFLVPQAVEDYIYEKKLYR